MSEKRGPSPARRGFDALLAAFPHREIESVDGLPAVPLHNTDGEIAGLDAGGPWMVVAFIGDSQYAIRKATGAFYRMVNGTVEDDRFLTLT